MRVPELIMGGFLLIAAIMDIRKREIPIWFSLISIIFSAILHTFIVRDFNAEYLMAAVIIFILMIAGMLFGGMGGADAIIGAGIGLFAGFIALWIMALSFALSVPYLVYDRKHEKKGCPFVLCLFVSYTIIYMYKLL